MAAVGDVTEGGDVSVEPHSERSMRRRTALLALWRGWAKKCARAFSPLTRGLCAVRTEKV